MEQRLIDANALLDTTEHLAQVCFGQGQCYCERTKFQQLIKKQPTVDAVPVSYIYKRAMELKNDDMMYAYTVLNSLIANYRADGERREQDDATN